MKSRLSWMLVLALLFAFAAAPAWAKSHENKGQDKDDKAEKTLVLPGPATSGQGEKTGHEGKTYGDDKGMKPEAEKGEDNGKAGEEDQKKEKSKEKTKDKAPAIKAK